MDDMMGGSKSGNLPQSKIEWEGVPGEKKYIRGKWLNEVEYKEKLKAKKEWIESSPEVFMRVKISKQKSNAIRTRNLDWNLNADTLVEQVLDNPYCAISGRKFVFKTGHMDSPSIDRIDSSKGYTPENVQIVTTAINIGKQNLETETFVALANSIVNHQRKLLREKQKSANISQYKLDI